MKDSNNNQSFFTIQTRILEGWVFFAGSAELETTGNVGDINEWQSTAILNPSITPSQEITFLLPFTENQESYCLIVIKQTGIISLSFRRTSSLVATCKGSNFYPLLM